METQQDGYLVEVAIVLATAAEMGRALELYLQSCQMGCEVRANETPFNRWAYRNRVAGQLSFGKVFGNKSKARYSVLVRVNGVQMFMRRGLKTRRTGQPATFSGIAGAPGVQPRLRRTPSAVKWSRMEVQLTSDQQAKLARIATEQGRAAETLVQEAVEQFLNYDEWFSLEVDKGLAAADRGEFVDHGDIRKMIDSRYPA